MSSTIQANNKKRNNKNANLHKAKSAKNDEFYTTRGTIEDELKWYKHHFKGKVVYCNCDDPYESEFFKYFMLQFKMLGLKKLIATCYKNSPVANKQLQLFSDEELLINCGNKAHKIEITSEDLEGENPSMENMKDILKRKKLVKNLPAKCDGSFDSKPCLKLLEEADIVVTNPPFSQFRKLLHEHTDGYKEEIEHVLAKSIYCSGCMGVPITMLDKYNPEQLEIVNPLDVSVDKPQSEPIIANAGMQECRNANSCTWSRRMACQRQTQVCSNLYPQDIVTESSECQLPSLINGVLNNLESSQCPLCQDVRPTIGQCLTVSQNIQESLSKRYCNGIMGVPITIIDKLNQKQFNIIGCSSSWMIAGIEGKIPSQKFMSLVTNGKVRTGGTPGKSKPCWIDNQGYANVGYHRIFIQKIL